MNQATPNPPADTQWAGERTITEFFPAASESDGLYKLASKIPLGLGLLLYAPAYVAKALNPFGLIRYTLTNRRIRVDRGTTKRTVRFVPLDDVETVRVRNYLEFTRTGDIEVVNKGEVVLRMVGVQDPEPIRRTILDAVNAYKQVKEVMAREQQNKSLSPA